MLNTPPALSHVLCHVQKELCQYGQAAVTRMREVASQVNIQDGLNMPTVTTASQ